MVVGREGGWYSWDDQVIRPFMPCDQPHDTNTHTLLNTCTQAFNDPSLITRSCAHEAKRTVLTIIDTGFYLLGKHCYAEACILHLSYL